MPVATERQALQRELILAAAEREFARAGFEGTKVTTIAHGAGVSLATVYKAFVGKDHVWDALHTERMAFLVAEVNARVRSTSTASPLGRLLAGVAAVAEFLTTHDAYLELNLRATSGWLLASERTGVLRTVWAAGLDRITRGVEAARDAGELADLPTRVATGLVVSALQVWLADWVESGRDRDAGAVVADLLAHLRLVLAATHPRQGESGA